MGYKLKEFENIHLDSHYCLLPSKLNNEIKKKQKNTKIEKCFTSFNSYLFGLMDRFYKIIFSFYYIFFILIVIKF